MRKLETKIKINLSTMEWSELGEKLGPISPNDEILIGDSKDGNIIKRIKAYLFKGDKGEKGDKGNTGKGIVSILKTGTNQLRDTYTIAYSDGTNTQFDLINGKDGEGTGDMLTSNNLQDLANKVTARNNLGVYSKAEIDLQNQSTTNALSSKANQSTVDSINSALGGKSNLNHTHSFNDLTGVPKDLGSIKFVKGYCSTSTNSINSKITFDIQGINNGLTMDTANGRFTTAENGIYKISVSVENINGGARCSGASILKNGVKIHSGRLPLDDYSKGYGQGGCGYRYFATEIMSLSAGDYIEVYTEGNGSYASITTGTGEHGSAIIIEKIK